MSVKRLDLNAIASEENVRVEYSIKSPEDPDEKKLRLHQELASYWIKEVGPFLIAALFVTVTAIYCFVVLSRASTPATERERAWHLISVILGVVLGAVFGKATEK